MDLKIALVEIGGSHEECLLSQMIALKSVGAQLTLICTEDIKDRNPHFEKYVDAFLVVGFTQKSWKNLKLMIGVNRFLKAEGYSKVIINTAQGGHIRNLCLTASRKIEFIGIIHTIRKFQGSFTQKIINRKIRKYLVLSDFLLDKITVPKKLKVESFYPLEYERFNLPLEKKAGETWVTIVGGVENRRKDLNGFVEMIQNVQHDGLKFIFLGKSDPNKQEVIDFRQKLQETNRLDQFVFFDDFIAPDLFDAYLSKTDFLCPLIHPETQSAEQYISNQISGAFNLAYSYQIPLLIHNKYQAIEDLSLSSFFYDQADFQFALNEAIAGRAEKTAEIATTGKWQKAFQHEKFTDFVLN